MNHSLPLIDNQFQPPKNNEEIPSWLKAHASAKRPYLLAFADDGVIWGFFDGSLKTAPEAFDADLRPELHGETLQQAFLFGEDDELRLFHGPNDEWRACLITDVDGQKVIDECQLLWGSKIVGKPADGFVHVQDRVQQTMDHVLPLRDLDLEKEAPRLLVRHFVDFDEETGEARIFLSRLVKLGTGPIDKEEIR